MKPYSYFCTPIFIIFSFIIRAQVDTTSTLDTIGQEQQTPIVETEEDTIPAGSTDVSSEADSPAVEGPTKHDTLVVEEGDFKTTIQWGEQTLVITKDSLKRWPEILLSLGFNFDFLDGVKADDLYADVSVDLPFLFHPDPANAMTGFGVELGIYQRRTVSYQDTLSEEYRLIDAVQFQNDSTAFKYITGKATGVLETYRENLGVFLQPKWILLSEGNTVKNTARLSVIGHIEWMRTTVNQSYNRNFYSIDTTSEVPDNWPRPYNTVDFLPPEEQKQEFIEYNLNYGVGVDLFVLRPTGGLHLKAVIGNNDYKILTSLTNGVSRVRTSDTKFYSIQVEIIETQVLGFKLGAEVRGYFGGENPPLRLEKIIPSYTVYLAKQFSLDKLADLFKPPGK